MRILLLACCVVALATPAGAGFRARAKDFKCFTEGTQPAGRAFRIFGRHHRVVAKALDVADQPGPDKKFPVGTILQVLPFEAMVKRGGAYNRAGGGWEFFQLQITPEGKTKIVSRGKDDVANALGSCQGCHARLAQGYDFVCEYVLGAAGLGLTDETLKRIQDADARCK